MTRKQLTRCLAVILPVVGLALFGSAAPTSAAYPGVNGKIAFQYFFEDPLTSRASLTIASVDPDGTHLRVLAVPPPDAGFGNPTWSPDGTRIAFDDGNVIYAMYADGSGLHAVGSGYSGASHPTWSPDGLALAYESASGGGSIHTINADGTGLLTLLAATATASYSKPAWSPDGSKIAVAANVFMNYGAWESNIGRVDADGTHFKLLTQDHLGVDNSPDWSPDGTGVVFTRLLDGNQDVMKIVPGFGVVNLTPQHYDYFDNPAWSPDGSLIVAAGTGFAVDYPLWRMNGDGSALTKIADQSDMPDWQPLVSRVPALPSASGAGPVGFTTSAGVFANLVPVDESTLPTAGKPAGVTFPFGFFDWTISGLTPGATVTVTLTFPAAVASPAQYWKVVGGVWTDLTSELGSDDGDNVLTLTVTDGGPGDADGIVNGEISDPGGLAVSLVDTVPPTITCPADLARPNDGGQAGAVVTYSVTATDDQPGVPTIAASPASGSFFTLGTTTVRATATDAAGNPASCSFVVTVNDTEPPRISCPDNIRVPTAPGKPSAVVSFTVSATDNAPGVTVNASPASGSAFTIGAHDILATATDAAGNTARCGFMVTVVDTEPPVITTPPNLTVDATSSAGAVVTDAQLGRATATDNSGLIIVVTRGAIPPGNLFPVGATTIAYTAPDASGNVATAHQTVTVHPFTPPPNTACTVSGAGWIDSAQPKYFAFAVRYQVGWSAPQGGVVYADTRANQYLQSIAITRLTCTGTHAEIAGTALTLAGTVAFTMQVDDRGARGVGDLFAIQWPGYQASRPVATGDIVVRIP